MADVIELKARHIGSTRLNGHVLKGLSMDEEDVFCDLLSALDEAECRPKVRAALVDALGYDPCENPYDHPDKEPA